eukprot:31179-Pelagococcus_subviridis.AAC.2
MELKGVSGLKAWYGRRETPGEKVLKERRSPRRRGRTGTGVYDRTRLRRARAEQHRRRPRRRDRGAPRARGLERRRRGRPPPERDRRGGLRLGPGRRRGRRRRVEESRRRVGFSERPSRRRRRAHERLHARVHVIYRRGGGSRRSVGVLSAADDATARSRSRSRRRRRRPRAAAVAAAGAREREIAVVVVVVVFVVAVFVVVDVVFRPRGACKHHTVHRVRLRRRAASPLPLRRRLRARRLLRGRLERRHRLPVLAHQRPLRRAAVRAAQRHQPRVPVRVRGEPRAGDVRRVRLHLLPRGRVRNDARVVEQPDAREVVARRAHAARRRDRDGVDVVAAERAALPYAHHLEPERRGPLRVRRVAEVADREPPADAVVMQNLTRAARRTNDLRIRRPVDGRDPRGVSDAPSRARQVVRHGDVVVDVLLDRALHFEHDESLVVVRPDGEEPPSG